jgi:hypothetical protein
VRGDKRLHEPRVVADRWSCRSDIRPGGSQLLFP